MKFRTIIRSLLLLIIVLIGLMLIKLPYYITQPGMASELKSIIKVENGHEEEGSFSLTTVRFGRANPVSYVWAKMNDYYKIQPIEEIRSNDESDEEYIERQLHMMKISQDSAIMLAYKKANKKVEAKYNGIYVMQVMKNMPAANVLQVGDRIYKANDNKFDTSEQFTEYISKKQAGEKVKLEYERKGKKDTAVIQLSPFPHNVKRAGIGISTVTDRELNVSPKITLNTREIGGPSAGLMMTLEIYNQLIEEDLTKGYKIAGTGTINTNGEVGPIGGISQKIVAAHKAGMDIFFAPNEKGAAHSNYNEAKKAAAAIKTKMKIIPVDTFDDAVQYLNRI
ncbi:SepM family pheromone-processing serine protease [Metabacillus fastidiosus]|uniref:SepM family pheromone-processing serine protease n=1 Tax=Metabacillus fastidiosus TaxID=1458 RepID=UPI003D2BE739